MGLETQTWGQMFDAFIMYLFKFLKRIGQKWNRENPLSFSNGQPAFILMTPAMW